MDNNKVLCVRYRDQKFDPEFVFPSIRLPGAKDPPNALRPEDLRSNNANDFQFGGRGRGFRGGRGGNHKLYLNITKIRILQIYIMYETINPEPCAFKHHSFIL